jgi:Ca2+-binding EF-hand superfamily protein
LINIVLDYHLSEHENTLRNFNQLFKRIDRDHDGKIDFDEFFDLMSELSIGLSDHQIGEFY